MSSSVLSLLLLLVFPSLTLSQAQTEVKAVSGIVSGEVQKVGFRAMILKQAIHLNLAGQVENLKDGTVHFTLQGAEDRIQKALANIGEGTKKSAAVRITTSAAPFNPALKTFTVIGWTSTTRGVTSPYNLVFTLRSDNLPVSDREAKKIYREILERTLSPADLKKSRDPDNE
ncbi:MAG: acylphosphatase [Verrucomicrobiae bacterium]|nr:acylphosphatase [Verrucomicrobiae bacterium]